MQLVKNAILKRTYKERAPIKIKRFCHWVEILIAAVRNSLEDARFWRFSMRISSGAIFEKIKLVSQCAFDDKSALPHDNRLVHDEI